MTKTESYCYYPLGSIDQMRCIPKQLLLLVSLGKIKYKFGRDSFTHSSPAIIGSLAKGTIPGIKFTSMAMVNSPSTEKKATELANDLARFSDGRIAEWQSSTIMTIQAPLSVPSLDEVPRLIRNRT